MILASGCLNLGQSLGISLPVVSSGSGLVLYTSAVTPMVFGAASYGKQSVLRVFL